VIVLLARFGKAAGEVVRALVILPRREESFADRPAIDTDIEPVPRFELTQRFQSSPEPGFARREARAPPVRVGVILEAVGWGNHGFSRAI
jgi:hypothetical protein